MITKYKNNTKEQWLHLTKILSVLFLGIITLLIAKGSVADVIPKSGHVITRGLVLGANNKPIYAEVNESGEFVNDKEKPCQRAIVSNMVL